MKLSYRHASITAGNELSLLRCQSDSRSREASCVLVDAGTGLDVADLLGPADDPVAVCLAHADHYQSLGECVRVGATVYRESRQSVRVVRKSKSSVMTVGHRPPNLRAGDVREQLTRDFLSQTT